MTGRRGRPTVGGLLRDARLGPDTLARVTALAEQEGVSRSEMVRRLIREALERREQHDA